jgi:molybdopterin-guanine dinucleotide biosynthesis protein A
VSDSDREAVLGVVLAGGANRRYDGRPKALEAVGGQRIADRVTSAMREVVERVVLVANDAATFGVLGLELRPDVRPGIGALGGIHTAVAWACEGGYRGALISACDMPFLSVALLRRLTAGATADEVVVPESASRRGMEPLCAFYGSGCLGAVESALERGERQVISFYSDVNVRTIPKKEVESYGDPTLLFLNVNSPADRARAEAALQKSGTKHP